MELACSTRSPHKKSEPGGIEDDDQILPLPADFLLKRVEIYRSWGRGVNLTLDPGSEDLVFLLLKFDVRGQLPVPGRGNQRQEWVKNPAHRGMVVTRDPQAV